MSATDKLVNSIIDAVDQRQNKKTSSYDTTAKVVRVEGNTAYVHIDGGVDETPASMDIMCHKGDTVQVRVGGGRAWITGNGTNPPTDDSTANYAVTTATGAYTAAKEAWDQADIAHEAAESAKVSAQEAKVSANEAKESAIEANNHANSALTQLSVVEDVVDTLNWITAHGIYIVTSDTEVVEGKYYFEATQVSSPSGNPREQNYFEYNSTTQKYVLTTDTTVTSGKTYYLIEQVTTTITDPTGYLELESVDEAMADYVQSHLALTDEGLYVLKDRQGYKILLAYDGMYVYDNTGALVATYGSNITFSTTRPFTIGNANSYIKYMQESGNWKIKVVADEIVFANGDAVATTDDVSTAQSTAISTAAADATTKADNAKLYADNYITSISSNNGIQVHALNNSSSNYTQIDSDGMNVYKGGNSVAFYGDTSRIGKTSANHLLLDTEGLKFYESSTSYPLMINFYTNSNESWGEFVSKKSTTTWSNLFVSTFTNGATAGFDVHGASNNFVTCQLRADSSNNYAILWANKLSLGYFDVNYTANTNDSDLNVSKADGVYIRNRYGGSYNWDYAGLTFKVKEGTTKGDYSGYLRMYSQGETTPYGLNAVLETGGGLFIGSGESPANHYSAKGTYTGEETYITSDSNIKLQCNGNTIADRRGVAIWQSDKNTIISPCKEDAVLSGNTYTDTTGYYYLGADNYRWTGVYANNILSNNGFYHGSHNSPIGSIIDAHLSNNKSLSANTFTMLTSITLPAGTWVCCCGVRFAAGTTGGRVCNLEASSGNGAYNISQLIPTSSAMTNFSFTKIVTSTSSTTLYLNAMSSVATTVNSGGVNYGTFIRAVRVQ